MQIHEHRGFSTGGSAQGVQHRGFSTEVHKVGEGYVSEVYRKGKLIHTVSHEDSQFHSYALAIEAAREWIDRTYPPGRIKYFGEV